MYGNEPQEHSDLEQIAEKAIFILIWIYVIEWFVKKAWHRPALFALFAVSLVAVVLISVHAQHFFWPVWIPLITGFCALGRMLRR